MLRCQNLWTWKPSKTLQFEGGVSRNLAILYYDFDNRSFASLAAITLAVASVLLILRRRVPLLHYRRSAIRPLSGEPFP